jgi:uncharacterized protein
MRCPVDGATLLMSDRQGIEIDYCTECRGVWLDRGELDRLIERSEREPERVPERRDGPSPSWSSGPPPKKKRGFLSEMFEFGD